MQVLVIGATGRQGGAVARELLAHGHTVRGLSRDIGSPRAKRLREQGAELVAGNLENREAIRAAADGVDAVFALTTPYEEGVEAEVRQGVNAARVAAELGLRLIYSSGAG
ncbi:NmrA family NAD(P)-binding protein [Nonomuraea diastatica]|uniref:NAD-dependent epimerase/dehydratase family protein n=1 Tax=Nonomuraea diastatica TaxID=1848329 RepID=A0A4R4VQ53_9ACTN|nr:NmrA family NAD(P)-binding protein [Nonomuraea diastatica]TDD08019.1 NAD-dependent epimerase/dehydratase family protein [Nonomuraea diastatica]